MDLQAEGSFRRGDVAFVDEFRRFNAVNILDELIASRFDSIGVPTVHVDRFSDFLSVAKFLDRFFTVFIKPRSLPALGDDFAQRFAV